MKVLVLADLWLPFPGGAERLIFNLARDLLRRGIEVEALTSYEPAQQFDGPPVCYRPVPVYQQRAEGLALVREHVRAVEPDAILTHAFFASQFGPELVADGNKVVQIMLNGDRLAGTEFAVYISQWVWDTYGGKDGDLLITPPVFEDTVAETHGPLVGFIKPIEHKGIGLFYEIAKAMPDRQFLVLRGEWYTLEDIRELPNVEFMQPVDDIREFYARCRLLLMPSRSEDAGTVAQEATANGLPCISTDVGGLRETNGGGLRIPLEGGASEWASAIRYLDDPAVYEEVVTNQRLHLATTGQADRLDAFAERILALHP